METLLSLLGGVCSIIFLLGLIKLQIGKYFGHSIAGHPKKCMVKIISVENVQPYKKVYVCFRYYKITFRAYFVVVKPHEFRAGENKELWLKFFFPKPGLLVADY